MPTTEIAATATATPGGGLIVQELSESQACAIALVAVHGACLAVTKVCEQLARRGCLVLAAQAVPGRPRVLILPPPACAKLRGAERRRDRWECVFAATLDGVRVEWRVARAPVRPGGAA